MVTNLYCRRLQKMIYALEKMKHFLLCTIRISEKIEAKIFSMKNKVVARENEKDLVKNYYNNIKY